MQTDNNYIKLKKENVLRFINFNYTPLMKKQIAGRILLLWLLNAITYLINISVITLILIAIISVFITICGIKLFVKGSNIKQQYLFCGTHSVVVSFILVIVSYEIVSFVVGENLQLLIFLVVLLVLSTMFYLFIVYRLIKKDAYKEGLNSGTKSMLMPTFAGILGASFARLFFNDVSQATVLTILIVITMAIALLINIGSIFLLKCILHIYLEKREVDSIV